MFLTQTQPLSSGTQGRTRTGTPAKAGDFESPASTIPPLGLAFAPCNHLRGQGKGHFSISFALTNIPLRGLSQINVEVADVAWIVQLDHGSGRA